jgi:hypothetical protein
MSKAKTTTRIMFAVLVTTTIMYAYTSGLPALLNPVKAQEATDNNTTTDTYTGTIAISDNLTFANPFYEATSGKVISQRILGTSEGSPQVELSTIQDATIQGVGNVTNLATWTNTLKPDKLIYATGKGVITAENGEMATWIANDIGRSDDKGIITYRGLILFNTVNSSSTSGKHLAFLNNMEALFMTKVNVNSSDRPQATKMWEWK